uniref:Dirigent protein n=1 Tax=Oryza punctata TaxID=4537 RepID=A0A0E0M0S3_ORYPU
MANCRKRSLSHAHLAAAAAAIAVATLLLTTSRRAAAEAEQQPIQLHFYMHDVVTGPGATAAEVVHGTATAARFGKVVVMDDLLTEGADRGSPPVGRAQGFYVFAALDADAPALLFSMNVVLAAGPYGGSTVAVMGRDNFARLPVRELPVVGGTGRFRMARGYALVRTAGEHGKNAVLEIDLFVHAPY